MKVCDQRINDLELIARINKDFRPAARFPDVSVFIRRRLGYLTLVL
jgi:hypothetical protein